MEEWLERNLFTVMIIVAIATLALWGAFNGAF
jgi:hypothetical protein